MKEESGVQEMVDLMVLIVFYTLYHGSRPLQVIEMRRIRQVRRFEVYAAVSQRRGDLRPLLGPALSDELEALRLVF